jgi:nucleotide-binding universal stress UspA family protein
MAPVNRTLHITEDANNPLHIVQEIRPPVPRVRHILVALDGSPEAETVLEHIRPLAQELSARVTLVRAVSPFETAFMHEWSLPEWNEGIADTGPLNAEGYLEALALTLRNDGIPTDTECLGGRRPADCIVERAAALGADLIALTDCGRGRGSGASLGSTAYGVVHTAECPVLLVGAHSRGYGHRPSLESQPVREPVLPNGATR